MIIDERLISVFGYRIEVVLAEKYETVLLRGVLNTRMKDFYDIFVFVKLRKSIDLKLFVQALEATSLNRGTVSNLDDAKRIIGNILSSDEMQKLWENYKAEDTYAAAIEWAQIIKCLEVLAEL